MPLHQICRVDQIFVHQNRCKPVGIKVRIFFVFFKKSAPEGIVKRQICRPIFIQLAIKMQLIIVLLVIIHLVFIEKNIALVIGIHAGRIESSVGFERFFVDAKPGLVSDFRTAESDGFDLGFVVEIGA